ncbi:hypothetical protein [Atopomonas hussainii]|uniref:hypothetical protein n=1 Tax=Atopomonas hussainii TaxID=1429083 RepID=UPI000900310D|nr:hypothetical protein [Atopomonas hussainii]
MRNGLSVFLLLLCLLSVCLLYWPVFGFEYVWDDVSLFLNSATLRAGDFESAVTQPVLPDTTYFRPLVMASYWLEFNLFGVDAGLSHALNLCIHLLNTVLLFSLVYLLRRPHSAWLPALVAAFYGLHPALVEPVAWVAGRFDLLVTFFCFLGGVAYFLVRAGFVQGFVVGGLFFMAALSKEMAIVFPLLLVVLNAFRFSDSGGRVSFVGLWELRFSAAGVLFFGCLYLMLRYMYFPRMVHSGVESMLLPFFQTISLSGHAFAFYLEQIVWPFSALSPMHPFDFLLEGARYYLGLAYFAGLVVFVLLAFFSRWVWMWAAAAGFLALLPVSYLLPISISENLGHARFLAFPLSFFVLALGVLVFDFLSKLGSGLRYLGSGALLLLLLYFSVNSSVYLSIWRSNYSLWSWTYHYNSNSLMVIDSYISSMLSYGDAASARAALERRPETLETPFFWARYHFLRGDYKKAILVMESGLEALYARARVSDGAIVMDLERSNDLVDLSLMHAVLAESYINIGMYDAAQKNMRWVSGGDTSSSLKVALLNSKIYWGLGDMSSFEREFQKVIRLEGSLPESAQYAQKSMGSFISEACTNAVDEHCRFALDVLEHASE